MNKPEEYKAEAPGQNIEYEIIINARPKKWLGKTITFQQLVVLAYSLYEENNSTMYTVAYSRGHDDQQEGSMVVGDSVRVKDKMVFNVTATNRS